MLHEREGDRGRLVVKEGGERESGMEALEQEGALVGVKGEEVSGAGSVPGAQGG